MKSLRSPTPIRRCTTANDFPCAWGLTASLLLPDPTIHGTSRVCMTIPSRRFSSSTKRSMLRHPCPVRPLLGRFLQWEKKNYPSWTFVNTVSSRDFSNMLPVFVLQSLPQVLNFSGSRVSTLATTSTLSFSDLLLRLNLCLHSPARLEELNPTLNEVGTKVQLLSLLDALYAEVFNCTQCRNLLA